jgi:hypothetical protein
MKSSRSDRFAFLDQSQLFSLKNFDGLQLRGGCLALSTARDIKAMAAMADLII